MSEHCYHHIFISVTFVLSLNHSVINFQPKLTSHFIVFFPNLFRLCCRSNCKLQDNIMITRWLCQPSSRVSFMYSCCLEYNLMRGGRSQWRSLGTVLFCKDWHRCWMSQNCRCRNQATTVCPPPLHINTFYDQCNALLWQISMLPSSFQICRSSLQASITLPWEYSS